MSENTVKVQMFGEFSLSCGGVVVGGGNDRSRKVKNLLAYLICSRERMVPVDELIRILGGDKKNAAPVAALRTTLYRARRTIEPIEEQVGLSLIITQNGMYGWNPDAAVELNTEQFESMVRSGIPEGPERTEYCGKMLKLFCGDFLRCLAGEPWVEPFAEYYRELYIAALEKAAPVLIESGLGRETAEYCREAIRVSPYHEPLYRWLMYAYASLGDAADAAAAYEELRTLLYKELGVIPEEETQRVYQELVLNAGGSALTPDSIRSQLQERDPVPGALICDYSSFKLFYQAEARAAARRGDAIHIGVLSLLGRDGKPLSMRSLERAMEQLHAQISKSLRTGDIAACCSASQYILMFVQANYENSTQVCERVVQAFFSAYPRSPIRIQSVVFPLEPMFEGGDQAQKRTWPQK